MSEGIYVSCPHCGGTGKVRHECEQYHLEHLKTLYEIGGWYSGSESLCVYRCRVCGQLWKIRWQYDPGTGSDNVWLRPGESRRGYEFTLEEAEQIRKELEERNKA